MVTEILDEQKKKLDNLDKQASVANDLNLEKKLSKIKSNLVEIKEKIKDIDYSIYNVQTEIDGFNLKIDMLMNYDTYTYKSKEESLISKSHLTIEDKNTLFYLNNDKIVSK